MSLSTHRSDPIRRHTLPPETPQSEDLLSRAPARRRPNSSLRRSLQLRPPLCLLACLLRSQPISARALARLGLAPPTTGRRLSQSASIPRSERTLHCLLLTLYRGQHILQQYLLLQALYTSPRINRQPTIHNIHTHTHIWHELAANHGNRTPYGLGLEFTPLVCR